MAGARSASRLAESQPRRNADGSFQRTAAGVIGVRLGGRRKLSSADAAWWMLPRRTGWTWHILSDPHRGCRLARAFPIPSGNQGCGSSNPPYEGVGRRSWRRPLPANALVEGSLGTAWMGALPLNLLAVFCPAAPPLLSCTAQASWPGLPTPNSFRVTCLWVLLLQRLAARRAIPGSLRAMVPPRRRRP